MAIELNEVTTNTANSIREAAGDTIKAGKIPTEALAKVIDGLGIEGVTAESFAAFEKAENQIVAAASLVAGEDSVAAFEADADLARFNMSFQVSKGRRIDVFIDRPTEVETEGVKSIEGGYPVAKLRISATKDSGQMGAVRKHIKSELSARLLKSST